MNIKKGIHKELEILCIIPARSGSKGVPKKNIKLLGDYPLLAYSIAAAKISKKITRTIVSTDSKEIADIALSFNAEVPFLRPSVLAADTSTDIDFILHALTWLENNENYIPDLIVLLRPTTPLRDSEYIDKAVVEFINNKNATSLRSSHLASESPFKWFYIKKNLYTTISKEYNLKDTGRPRQSFPDAYIPNGYVDIISTEYTKKNNSLFGDKILAFVTPIGHEVDTLDEFEYLEYKVSKENSKLLEYLKKIKSKHD